MSPVTMRVSSADGSSSIKARSALNSAVEGVPFGIRASSSGQMPPGGSVPFPIEHFGYTVIRRADGLKDHLDELWAIGS